jgi:ribose/xylose/arabinose/galactoside ABC-type transport system permease subunit
MTQVRSRYLQSEYLVLILSVVYCLALAPFTPGFVSPSNAANLLSTLFPLFIVGVGEMLVLIAGGIDLSVTSILGLTSVTGAALLNGNSGWLSVSGLGIPVAILAMLAVGALVGLVNGMAVSKLKMPPFIVTLTSMMFVSGLAIWSTRSRNIGNLPETFNHIGSSWVFALGMAIVLGLGVHAALSRTVWGGWLYAIGHNSRAAFISGVPVAWVTVSAYLASGILSAAASILYTGQAESGSPVLGQRLLLDVIGGVVIGGTSLFGGRGKVLWTLFGVLFLKLLDNSLNLLDLSYFVIMMVKGAVILLAAVIDAARTAPFRK